MSFNVMIVDFLRLFSLFFRLFCVRHLISWSFSPRCLSSFRIFNVYIDLCYAQANYFIYIFLETAVFSLSLSSLGLFVLFVAPFGYVLCTHRTVSSDIFHSLSIRMPLWSIDIQFITEDIWFRLSCLNDFISMWYLWTIVFGIFFSTVGKHWYGSMDMWRYVLVMCLCFPYTRTQFSFNRLVAVRFKMNSQKVTKRIKDFFLSIYSCECVFVGSNWCESRWYEMKMYEYFWSV